MRIYSTLLLALVSAFITYGEAPSKKVKLSELIEKPSASQRILVVPIVDASNGSAIDNDKYLVQFSVCNESDSSVVAESNMIMPEGYAARFTPTETSYLLKVEVCTLQQESGEGRYRAIDPKISPYWVKLNCSDCKAENNCLHAPSVAVSLPTEE